jgi:hypothetical protein
LLFFSLEFEHPIKIVLLYLKIQTYPQMRNLKFEYKITAIYLILGGIWILFSDNLLFLLFNDGEALT